MDLQTFMKSVTRGESSGDSSEGSSKHKFDFFLDRAEAPALSLSELPVPMRNAVDELAASVLDLEGKKTVVTGSPFAGKTFLIEQFAHNLSSYLKKTSHGPLHILRIDDVAMMQFSSAEELRAAVTQTTTSLGVLPRNVCFYTESPELALYLTSVVPEWRVLLETNNETFEAIIRHTFRSTSKAWQAWSHLNVDDIMLTEDSMVSLLMASMVPRLAELYPSTFTERQLRSFLKQADEALEGLHLKTTKGSVLRVPAGIWAVMLRGLASSIAYTSDPKYLTPTGAPSVAKLTGKTLKDLVGLTSPILEETSGPPTPSQMVSLITTELEEMLQLNGGPPSREMGPLEDLVFKDVGALGKRLKKSIFGQDEAVERIASGFVVPAAGLNDPSKPVRSLFLLGPTGVGKTQVAINLAKELTEEPMNLVRIDMSEYQQEHEVAKLFGAPPGYVGHDSGGFLTSAVMEHPQSLIILDEVEKAHPKIWDAFLQILDSGTMTDSQGQVVNFTKTVLVMTSNIGASEAAKARVGFLSASTQEQEGGRAQESARIVQKALETSFRPEFLNRLDDVIVFQALTHSVATAIVKREVSIVAERMKAKGFTLPSPSSEVIEVLLEKADISRYGAREIQRIVFKNVASPAAHFIVGNSKAKSLLLTTSSGDVFVTEAKRKNPS